jgi:hypothetical protein
LPRLGSNRRLRAAIDQEEGRTVEDEKETFDEETVEAIAEEAFAEGAAVGYVAGVEDTVEAVEEAVDEAEVEKSGGDGA